MNAFYNSRNDVHNFSISFSINPKQHFCIFAKGYGEAASVLSDHLLEKTNISDDEAYPVIFLYRHATELYLKGFYLRAAMISGFRNNQEFNNNQKIIRIK